MANAYFGSTLTDAQRAMSMAAQQEIDADIARRNYLAQIMQGRLRQQQLAQNENMFGQEMGLRGQELGLRGQEAQVNALVKALSAINAQKELEQNATLTREGFANRLALADKQYNPSLYNYAGDREAAEKVRQEGMLKQNEMLLNDEIDTHNTQAEATASRYNALLKSLTDEKDTMFTARSTAQQKAWRELLDAVKVGGDDKMIKPEVGVDAATKEVQYKFVPLLRSRPKLGASPQKAASPVTDSAAIIRAAQQAIASGADPAAVTNRLTERYNLQLPAAQPTTQNVAPPYDMAALQPFVNALRNRVQLSQPEGPRVMPIPGYSSSMTQPAVDWTAILSSYAGR